MPQHRAGAFHKPAPKLTLSDFRHYPVWEFTSRDQPDETYVRPVRRLPVSSLRHRLIGVPLRLASGREIFGMLGHLDPADPFGIEHLLTVSLRLRRSWFPIARYHDPTWDTHGPAACAEALRLPIAAVFPIAWDVSALWGGDAGQVRGTLSAIPPARRLSKQELIRIIVGGLPAT